MTEYFLEGLVDMENFKRHYSDILVATGEQNLGFK